MCVILNHILHSYNVTNLLYSWLQLAIYVARCSSYDMQLKSQLQLLTQFSQPPTVVNQLYGSVLARLHVYVQLIYSDNSIMGGSQLHTYVAVWLQVQLAIILCVCMCPLQSLLLPHWNVILDEQMHYYFYPKMEQNEISDQLNFNIFRPLQHEVSSGITVVLNI